jgi:hypothetical protein
VNYHFEAPHSGGSTLRFPANGELRYQMNGDVQLYAQDFESGAPGWTHAMVATQDDWHIGDPAGLSGTGWVDPQTAAGGVSVYGNDLGNTINGQAYNGAYQNNVNNYLLSPVINCSGRTNVRLRFKRWLTVQASPNDNATISVNSVPVWTNPSTGNLVDTSWQAVDLAIPQADNNPAVRIEWRLVTNASTVFGGWNIDDVEVVAAGPTPPALVTIMRLQPEQSAVGSPLSLVVTTPPSKPLLVAFAFSPGPTLLPGIPPLQVGGELLTIFAISNAFGVHTQTFPSPPSAPATGFYLYGHTLSFDLADNIVASNPWFNYFTPTP